MTRLAAITDADIGYTAAPTFGAEREPKPTRRLAPRASVRSSSAGIVIARAFADVHTVPGRASSAVDESGEGVLVTVDVRSKRVESDAK